MKRVEVLLRDDVPNLGRCGDVVAVAAGYARNYLLPRGVATAATPENVKVMVRRRERQEAERAALMADIEARVTALEAHSINAFEKADENGHLYGSVNAAAIVKLLAGKGHAVEEKQVRLEQPIKTVGTHPVEVHVHGEHSATVTLVVHTAAG